MPDIATRVASSGFCITNETNARIIFDKFSVVIVGGGVTERGSDDDDASPIAVSTRSSSTENVCGLDKITDVSAKNRSTKISATTNLFM